MCSFISAYDISICIPPDKFGQENDIYKEFKYTIYTKKSLINTYSMSPTTFNVA